MSVPLVEGRLETPTSARKDTQMLPHPRYNTGGDFVFSSTPSYLHPPKKLPLSLSPLELVMWWRHHTKTQRQEVAFPEGLYRTETSIARPMPDLYMINVRMMETSVLLACGDSEFY